MGLKKIFQDHANSCLQYNREIGIETVVGHPDIFTSDLILDIKTTTDFNKLADHGFFQILCYATLARTNGYDVSRIGLVLPLQMSLLIVDVSDWDSSGLLALMLNPTSMPTPRPEIYDPLVTVGTHLGKSKSFLKTIETYIQRFPEGGVTPCQMFLRNPRGGKCNMTVSEQKLMAALIKKSGLKFFVHSPYIINLSNPYTKRDPTSDQWVLDQLRDDLIKCRAIGGLGVVVHVGKATTMKRDDALKVMESSIRRVLDSATEDCPLLLETGAGCGTELLCESYSAFESFFRHFEGDKRFGICLDTCHCFSAGRDPYNFLVKWLERNPSSLKLIHFNDSAKPKGSKVDRHAGIGAGFIGYEKMIDIAILANKHGIPMVIE